MNKDKARGFTLVEVLVSVSVLIIIGLIIVGVTKHVRTYSYSAICLNNLRQISLGLASYFNDFNDYPAGLPENLLKDELKKYTNDQNIFICPEDRFENQDSYSRFYVYRGSRVNDVSYVIGCPRHRHNKSAINVFSLGSTRKAIVAPVLKDTVNIVPGEVVEPGGTILLDDGSKITASSAKVMVVQSFRMDDGTLYSVIRILDGEQGSVTCDVIPGSRLEIVTPSVIAAVRGTTFIVSLSYDNGAPVTKVGVTAGEVAVYPISSGSEKEDDGNYVKDGNGGQVMLCTAGTEITVAGKKRPMPKPKDLSDYLDDLHNKIGKMEEKEVDHACETSFYNWMSQYINENGQIQKPDKK